MEIKKHKCHDLTLLLLLQRTINGKLQHLGSGFQLSSHCSWKLCSCCPGTESSHPQEGIPSDDMGRLGVLGSGPPSDARRKQSQSFGGDPQGEPPGLWVLTPGHSCSLAAHRQCVLREPVQDSCAKGETYSSKTEEWQRPLCLDFLIKPPLVGTSSSINIAGLVYMCAIMSYSNLSTRDRNPVVSILKACWHLSTWQIIKAPRKSQE